MSQNIDPVFVSLFDTEVKASYGDKAKLKGTVRTKLNVVGSETYFNKKGKGMATRHIRGTDRKAMNVDYSRVKCVLTDWDAFDYVDKFDMKKTNISEIKETAAVATQAIGMRQDQIIINAISAGYDSTNMKVGITTALTTAELRKASALLNKKGVPTSDRYFAHTAQQLDDLLATTQATSTDYNAVHALVDGTLSKFVGFNFVMIASRDEGGLPQITESSTLCDLGFCYHKDAIGYAEGQDIQTEISWIAEKGAYLVGADFSAGAVVIDDEGIVGVYSKA